MSQANGTRLEQAFARSQAEGRKALVIYLTAGDPDPDTSRRLLLAAADAGADILELGIPWSDPSADGPAIQAAMRRALAQGGGPRRTLELCRQVREARPDPGLVLFGYANPMLIAGPRSFAARARSAGCDGVLCVDWPADEDRELAEAVREQKLDLIPLLAPTSTPPRVAAALEVASGFVYYVSLTGITGAALTDLAAPRSHVAEIRRVAGRLPIVVGFGVSTPDDVRRVAEFADGVVVGSAAVRVIERAVAAGRDPVPELGSLVRELRESLGR